MIFRSRTKNTFFEVITVKTDELIMALQKLKVQTGSLACLGCKHEDTCGEHGCALIREAVTQLIEQNGWVNPKERLPERGVPVLRNFATSIASSGTFAQARKSLKSSAKSACLCDC